MKQWGNDIINFFFPAHCHICESPLASHEKFLCTHCIEHLPRTGYHREPRNPMEQRFAGQFPFEAATGHFFYSRDSSLAQLIQDMKYRGFSSIGNLLGEIAGRELFSAGFLSDINCIIPVPMHFWKKAKRGFNQTDHIAEGISKTSGIPVLNALKMTRERKSQTSLTQAQRLENAKNLFSIRKNIDLGRQSVMLVDDVCTTGTTLASAAKAITDNFPDVKLYLFTIGVTF